MDLDNFIAEIPEKFKVSYVGVAALAPAYDFILQQGGDYIAQFPVAISMGIALPNAIVDLLPRRKEKAVRVSYRHHAYDMINQRLDIAASEVAWFLQRAGNQAFPVPASKRADDERICASFSHKLGAHLSGLGWIGKSCLLVTPDHGPRVRWVTVLTDAPLHPTGEPMQDRCGDCTQCVDICPLHAFTGKQFISDEPREVRYKADLCDRYLGSMESQGDLRVCGLCLYVCPFGRNKA
jgi:epoxyqueuosine reductase